MDETNEYPPSPGITVLKWDSLRIPIGGLLATIGENGEPDISLKVTTRINAWMHWLDIALQHLRSAQAAHEDAVVSRQRGDVQLPHEAILREYQASLQSSCACAYSAEAFWYALLDYNVVPQERLDEWKLARTARPKRLWSTILLASRIPRASQGTLRQGVISLFEFRNIAIHPGLPFEDPVLHPELKIGLDRSYVRYRFQNASNGFAVLIELLVRTLVGIKPRDDQFDEWVRSSRQVMVQFLDESKLGFTSPDDIIGQLRGDDADCCESRLRRDGP